MVNWSHLGMPATGSKELPSTPFLQITSSLHLLGLQDMALSFVQPKNWLNIYLPSKLQTYILGIFGISYLVL